MSKKDYILIASIVRQIEVKKVRDAIANEFAVKLAAQNPEFRKQTFLDACGAGGGKRKPESRGVPRLFAL